MSSKYKTFSSKNSAKPARPIKKAHFIWQRFKQALANIAPKGLYGRTLLIIVLPLLLLQIVMVIVFMERHWNQTTRLLSASTVKNIATIIKVHNTIEGYQNQEKLISLARESMGLSILFLPKSPLPNTHPKSFFKVLNQSLSEEIKEQIHLPFWLDTVGNSEHVEIRFSLTDSTLQVFVLRSQTVISNAHIFFVWMFGTSLFLLTLALLFLRNQIRPILALSQAAEAFGKGQLSPNVELTPKGATEIKDASVAFIRMRDRIERHVDQRTTLLAGVSHDLRTILTRMKLELALAEDREKTQYLRGDIDEMFHMLEDYMAFAKGVDTEGTKNINIRALLEKIRQDTKRMGKYIDLDMRDGVPVIVKIRPNAMKRAITNLVTNAIRMADKIILSAYIHQDQLYIIIDDDGPGIPEKDRENVFHPFHRLDQARNQNEGNSGLGLAISCDIAHTHGGNITLLDSPLGGLRAQIKIPI